MRQTIPDKQGNYDIDGVSFDPEKGVIVASDDTRFVSLISMREALTYGIFFCVAFYLGKHIN